MCEQYNGWNNRETWAAKLHLDNDQYLNEIAWEYARANTSAYELGETLKNWVEEDLLTFENITVDNSDGQYLWLMLTDIGSLYRVDWREIAQSYLDEIAIELQNAL
jgi:thiamine kinase-like enzyme